MAAHNAEAFIEPALDSVLGQTMDDIEVIVVDDASTDSTAARIGGVVDARIVLVSLTSNVGAAAARNVALDRARGVFAAIMDADDVSWPQRLKVQTEFLLTHPEIGLVGSQIRVIDHRGRIVGRRRYPVEHAQIVQALPRWNPIAHSTVMIRTESLRQAGGYDEAVRAAHDYDLWSRLARDGARFANLPFALVDYRIHTTSIKTRMLRDSIENTLEVQSMHWSENARLGDRIYRYLERILLRLPARAVNSLFVLTRYRLPTLGARIRACLCLPSKRRRGSP